VTLVVSEPTERAVIKLIDVYESQADAFEVNLTALKTSSFQDIFSSTKRPCIATNRRSKFMKFYGYEGLPETSEETRVNRLDIAASSGASAIDCELDIFDEENQQSKPEYMSDEERAYASNLSSEPAELSKNKDVVHKQIEFVRSLKDRGNEVIFSCHTQTVLRKGHGASIMAAVKERGGDFGKIVSLTLAPGDLPPFFESIIYLKDTSHIPFTVMNVGSESILGRLVAVKLGSSWVYCRPDTKSAFNGQPNLAQARDFLAITGIHRGAATKMGLALS
jgi:3-dehydroquinate dehydratase